MPPLDDPYAMSALSSSPRHMHFPAEQSGHSSTTSSAIQSLTSASTLESKLDLSPTESAARMGVLRGTVFDNWKDDTTPADLESPEDMQKKDPLGTQIWKLYSKNKSQLPNAERMENLTWRMMSMNLRRKEMERQTCVPLQDHQYRFSKAFKLTFYKTSPRSECKSRTQIKPAKWYSATTQLC